MMIMNYKNNEITIKARNAVDFDTLSEVVNVMTGACGVGTAMAYSNDTEWTVCYEFSCDTKLEFRLAKESVMEAATKAKWALAAANHEAAYQEALAYSESLDLN